MVETRTNNQVKQNQKNQKINDSYLFFLKFNVFFSYFLFFLSIIVFLTIFLLISISSSYAFPALSSFGSNYHMTLLSVNEKTFTGGTADLYLQLKPGSGRVFIDSFPVSKLDTQFSTRYANEVACDFVNVDCSKYDFFYTIKADSSIIGGPSAGAAMTIITIAALEGIPIRDDVAITGTINSGGLIGPVAGVIPKSLAAKHVGIKTVLIPGLVSMGLEKARYDYIKKGHNLTALNLINITAINYSEEYDKKIIGNLSSNNFKVIRVNSLYDALPYFVQKNFSRSKTNFKIDAGYLNIMKKVSYELCDHRNQLVSKLNNSIFLIESSHYLNYSLINKFNINNSFDINKSVIDNMFDNGSFDVNSSSNNLSYNDIMLISAFSSINKLIPTILNKSEKNALNNSKYYSAASICFSQSIKLQTNILELNEFLPKNNIINISIFKKNLTKSIDVFKEFLNTKKLNTISDVETMAIVQDRLIEAENILLKKNISLSDLAYAYERAYSAKVWSNFFNMKSKPYIIDNVHLRLACFNKLGQVEERVLYVESILPSVLTKGPRSELDLARDDAKNQNYALCLFKASKAGAQANILTTIFSVSKSKIGVLLNQKFISIKEVLSNQFNDKLFPIMGYSYYEYAHSLNESDPYSALTFAEYALELSDLHLYFPKKSSFHLDFNALPINMLIVFLIGFFCGVFFYFLLSKNLE